MFIDKSLFVLVALLSLGMLGMSGANADEGAGPVKVSADPYTDAAAQHRTEVEPSMVAHDDTIVVAFQVGRFFSPELGSDNIGWATSTDGGRKWRHGFLTGTTTIVGGQWKGVNVPVAAYDRKHHTYLIAMMPFDAEGNGRGVMVSRSEDGLHWSVATTAVPSTPTFGGTFGHWLACDNHPRSPLYGNCYDAYLDLTSPIGNFNDLIVSRDGGVTWSAPIYSPDSTAGLPTSMAIQPNGNVFVFGRNAGPNGDQQYSIPSTDGGASLQPSVYITTQQFDYPYLRSDPILTSAVGKEGTIYVVFPDCRFRAGCLNDFGGPQFPPNDLVMTTSADGINWSPIERIPIDPMTSSTDHEIPAIGVLRAEDEDDLHPWDESHTHLVVTYYYIDNGQLCVPANCDLNAGSVSSDDGGKSWHPAQKIYGPMQQTWLASTYAGQMVSDFLTLAFVHGRAFGTFALAKPPNETTGLLDEAIYATPLEDRKP